MTHCGVVNICGVESVVIQLSPKHYPHLAPLSNYDGLSALSNNFPVSHIILDTNTTILLTTSSHENMMNPNYLKNQENFCFDLDNNIGLPAHNAVTSLIDIFNTFVCGYYNLFVPEYYSLYNYLPFDELVNIPEFFALKKIHDSFFSLAETLFSIPLAAALFSPGEVLYWAHLDVNRARLDTFVRELIRASEFIFDSLTVGDLRFFTFNNQMHLENYGGLVDFFDTYASLVKFTLQLRHQIHCNLSTSLPT